MFWHAVMLFLPLQTKSQYEMIHAAAAADGEECEETPRLAEDFGMMCSVFIKSLL